MTTTSSPSRPAWAEVALDAIAANIASVKRFVGQNTGILSVVKANAYGHGLIRAAQAALRGGAIALGVALLEEGEQLRRAGISAPILVMGGTLPEQAPALIAADLDATVSNRPVIRALSQAAQARAKPGRLHLKIDTGLGRIGVSPQKALDLAKLIVDLPGLELEGVSTHIAWEEQADLPKAREQIEKFRTVLNTLNKASLRPRLCHAANSVMTVHLPESHFDLVRVGLLTYGIPPTGGALPLDLQPALTLKSRIVQIRFIPPGQSLSYGGTFTVSRPSRIAILPIGYADGYSRHLSNRACVLVRNHRCPVVGAVCMDQILLDVTHVPDIALGDEAVLIGRTDQDEIPVWELVRAQDGIPHEVVSQLSTRLPRIYP